MARDPQGSETLAVVPWSRLPAPFVLLFAAGMGWSFRDAAFSPGLLFWLALTAALAWFGLSLLLDSAHLRLRPDVLEVVHRPLPWPWPRRAVPRHRIGRVRVSYVSSAPNLDGEAGGWELAVVTTTGETVPLLDGPTGDHYQAVAAAATTIGERLGVPVG